MKHRSGISISERKLRSRINQLLASPEGILNGSLIEMARTCGNSNCKCILKGEKHVSLYLGKTKGKKTKMQYIPKIYEENVKKWGKNYKLARDLLEAIGEERRKILDQALKKK